MCHKLSGEEEVSKTQAELGLVYLMLIDIGPFFLIFLKKLQKDEE